jgi:hypothetical protein
LYGPHFQEENPYAPPAAIEEVPPPASYPTESLDARLARSAQRLRRWSLACAIVLTIAAALCFLAFIPLAASRAIRSDTLAQVLGVLAASFAVIFGGGAAVLARAPAPLGAFLALPRRESLDDALRAQNVALRYAGVGSLLAAVAVLVAIGLQVAYVVSTMLNPPMP